MAILDISDLNDEQRRRLMLAGAAAGGTFAFLLIAGALAGSQALIADGLDFAALAVSTGLALILKEAPAAMRAGARLVITVVLGLIGLAVALATLHGFAARVTPEPSLMGAAALVALAANGTTLYLLREEREGTSVLRGLWFAARTDLVGSAAVLIAAGVVALVDNAVPDLTVAGVIVVLFFVTLVPELRAAMAQWESQRTGIAAPPGDPKAH
ncbi:MAG TPA: cation transporter [Devosia sp.]|jgi:Co/Zn/Cd efflux system component|nr:cation transporter [Devosia sp.]